MTSRKRLAIVAVCAVAGFLIGFSLLPLAKAVQNLQGWRQLDVPADRTALLFRGWHNDGTSILIMSGDKFYSCDIDAGGMSRIPCKLARSGLNDNSGYEYDCPSDVFSTPVPPGKVIAQQADYPCSLDTRIVVHRILLEDGTMWAWRGVDSDFEAVLWVVCSPAFGLIGAAIGLTISALATHFTIERAQRTNPHTS